MLEGQLAEHNRSQTAARKISQGVRELDRLVVEILDFAQEQRLDIHACKLGSVLSQVEDATRPWAQTYGAKVAIDLEAGDVDVFCDPARLGQVLLNLLLNGVQAAGQDGCVRLSAAKGQNGGTRIEVSDNGPGIPAEHLDKMFNPFFTTRESGTGLGLAIAHRIVEAHEGTIKASNRTKGGARFVVELPPLKD
jgi:two-component system sensor histidine kinase HydH